MDRFGYKVLSDSTLMSLSKKKLIELLRVAEHNFFVTDKALDTSAENSKDLITGAFNNGFQAGVQATKELYLSITEGTDNARSNARTCEGSVNDELSET